MGYNFFYKTFIWGNFSFRRYRLDYKYVIKRLFMKIIGIGPWVNIGEEGPVLKHLWTEIMENKRAQVQQLREKKIFLNRKTKHDYKKKKSLKCFVTSLLPPTLNPPPVAMLPSNPTLTLMDPKMVRLMISYGPYTLLQILHF